MGQIWLSQKPESKRTQNAPQNTLTAVTPLMPATTFPGWRAASPLMPATVQRSIRKNATAVPSPPRAAPRCPLPHPLSAFSPEPYARHHGAEQTRQRRPAPTTRPPGRVQGQPRAQPCSHPTPRPYTHLVGLVQAPQPPHHVPRRIPHGAVDKVLAGCLANVAPCCLRPGP